jgi:hypothetical protein
VLLEIGEIYTKADWSGMTLRRLGFGRAIQNNFGVSFEVGGYFVGKSEFVDGTKMLSLIRNGKDSNEIRRW